MEWRLIETAEKNEAHIIGCDRFGERRVIWWWEPDKAAIEEGAHAEWVVVEGGSFVPTHWMPLPAAPQ